MTSNNNRTRSERIEGLVLIVILLIVAGFAGAASFTHVKNWTLNNSPAGTGEWFGWANAVISELIPAAALLTIRRRRRSGGSIGYPMFLLVCAVALSLAAQLAVAKPGLSGWLLSAVPALAFLGLSKLVLTTAPTPADTDDPAPTRLVKRPPPAPARPVERPEPAPAPAEPTPVALVPVEPTRPAPLAPVSPAAFVRLNSTTLAGEVAR